MLGRSVCPRQDCSELLTYICSFNTGHFRCSLHGRIEAAEVVGIIPSPKKDLVEAAHASTDEIILGLLQRIDAAAALHQPQSDKTAYSLVQHIYCSCGAMEKFVASDGYAAIGPAKYPCATVRALMGESDAD